MVVIAFQCSAVTLELCGAYLNTPDPSISPPAKSEGDKSGDCGAQDILLPVLTILISPYLTYMALHFLAISSACSRFLRLLLSHPTMSVPISYDILVV